LYLSTCSTSSTRHISVPMRQTQR